MAEERALVVYKPPQDTDIEGETTPLTDLRQKIKAVIEPWRHPKITKPPFTVEQLVVMVLLLSDKPLSREEILESIVDAFRYYRCLVVDGFMSPEFHPWGTSGPSNLRHDLRAAIGSFEVHLRYQSEEAETTLWAVSRLEGAIYLQNILEKFDEPEIFNFFGLPAELRMTIYEMVFQYPMSGLKVKPCPWTSASERNTTFHLASRSYNESFDTTRWESGLEAYRSHGNPVETKTVGEILAPLLTCRQFYGEAMPTFYSINHFVFESLKYLLGFLVSTAAERKQHIAHLSVRYNVEDVCHLDDQNTARTAFKALAELSHLRKLNICTDEQFWLSRGKVGRSRSIAM